MNKRQLISILNNFNDEDEIKAVKKDGEETIKLVIIRKEEAEQMNEALDIEPDEVPIPDFVSLEDNTSPPDENNEDNVFDDDIDEFRDDDEEENESFLREQGLIGSDSDNQPY